MYKVLVCGSRSITDYTLVKTFLEKELLPYSPDVLVISGCAAGPDKLALQFAEEHNLPTLEMPAGWDKYGKRAGYIRNKQMIDENPDLVIAFWDKESKGTKNTLNLAKEKNIPTLIIYKDM